MIKNVISIICFMLILTLAFFSYSAFGQQSLSNASSITPTEVPIEASKASIEIPAGIQRVLNGHNLPAGSYGFKVQELGTNVPILAINTSGRLNPASAIKTVTTLVALEELGPAYTWQTDIYALGPINNGTLDGDLLIKGGGDPFLVVEEFWKLLKTLKRRGIERITGDLVIDQTFFDNISLDPAGFDGQGSRSYNVIPNALLLNFQVVTFYFYPHDNGRDVIIRSNPELANLQIDNRLSLINGGCGGFQRGIAFDQSEDEPDVVIFSGKYPASCGEYSMSRSVLTAPDYIYGLFQQLWAESGGEFEGELVISRLNQINGQLPFLSWPSAPLSDVITLINKFSNNVMVRHLLLTLAAEQYEGPATVENGVRIVEAYLQSKGFDVSQINMINGAGLSREVSVTPNLLVDVLNHAASSAFAPEFISSLPIGGLDGTMRARFRNRAAAGNMHIKTGSLTGVSAVAGYVNARSGKQYAVTGMLNHELANRGPGSELMDSLLQWVYEQ